MLKYKKLYMIFGQGDELDPADLHLRMEIFCSGIRLNLSTLNLSFFILNKSALKHN